MKTIDTPEGIPSTPHFAALVFSTYTIPGDERSRTHPGHGYPESTGTSVQYIQFETEQECQGWVEKQETRTYGKERYRIINATPCTVKTSVSVSIWEATR